jgi:hypothetical protein
MSRIVVHHETKCPQSLTPVRLRERPQRQQNRPRASCGSTAPSPDPTRQSHKTIYVHLYTVSRKKTQSKPASISNIDDMIKLFGLKPFDDIDIVFTGMRSGEKLFEELNTEGEFSILNS